MTFQILVGTHSLYLHVVLIVGGVNSFQVVLQAAKLEATVSAFTAGRVRASRIPPVHLLSPCTPKAAASSQERPLAALSGLGCPATRLADVRIWNGCKRS